MDGLVIEFWYWWIAGVVLLVLEIFAPGTVFLWLGVAAGVVGLLLLLIPDLSWQVQFLAFAVLSIAAAVIYRQVLRRRPPPTDEPGLNRRGQQHVGRTVTLLEPIVNGFGRARSGESIWRVAGEDMPAGARVVVTGVEGTVLRVERRD